MQNNEFVLETTPSSPIDTSVMSVLENRSLAQNDKALQFETFYRIPITKKRDYIGRWGLFLSQDVEGILTPDQIKQIVDKFVEFHNINDDEEGQKAGHNILTNFLYSDLFLPALVTIYNYASQNNDRESLRQSSFTLLVLNDALDILQTPNSDELRNFDRRNLASIKQTGSTNTILKPLDRSATVDLAEVLPRLYGESMFGHNTDLQNFYNLMNLARLTAFQCIQENHHKPIHWNPGKIKPPKNFEINNFSDLAEKAEKHFLELQEGVSFPEEMLGKISGSKALVLSIDWNSVWNIYESYANSHIIALTAEIIKKLSNDFRKRFPDKEIFFVMNTGRPAHYAWGVIEALTVVKELRLIGLAESGGVILKSGMTKGETEVAVDKPKIWEAQLQALKAYLLNKIKDHALVHIEPKQSMLSIRLAEKDSPQGPWLHATHDGTQIDPDWISRETKNFLLEKVNELTAENMRFTTEISSDEQVSTRVTQALEDLSPEEIPAEDLGRVAAIFKDENEIRGKKLIKNREIMAVLKQMREKLVVEYNVRAGYIDIFHSDLNKYSTLKNWLLKQGLKPEELAFFVIGDSNTDIIPEKKTGLEEVNDGADQVMLIAVGNASKPLREAVERRQQRNNRGIQTVTPSILGLISIIKGLNRLIISK